MRQQFLLTRSNLHIHRTKLRILKYALLTSPYTTSIRNYHASGKMPPQTVNLSSLNYVRPNDLASELLDDTTASKVAVVDVRDNDYLGGHIKGSVHAPVDQLDARMPELLRTLKDKEKVVFHCMLSQQRGPKSALQYARAKAAEEDRAKKNSEGEVKDDGTPNGVIGKQRIGGQEICVLEGGFGMWQSKYGQDKKLTEGYVKELWESVLG